MFFTFSIKRPEKRTFLVLFQSRDLLVWDKIFYTDHVFHIVYYECRCDLCLLHTVGSDTILSLRPTDYGLPERKLSLLHGRKFNPNPKFLGTAEAYFVCHIGPIFQISLIYVFIGCP